jgi:cytoskeleton protein RodZ
MTSERAEQPAAPEQHHGVPGKALAAQREALGWTVEQVADQLKLAVRQVIALEAGDYASLPSPAVTRGFVRAYAKILKMDAAPLVAMIEMDTPPAPTGAAPVRRAEPTSFSEVRFSPGGKRPSLPLGWIAGAAVVVIAAAAAWHFGLLGSLRGGGSEAGANGAASMTTLPSPASGSASAPSSASGAASETVQSASVPLISVPSPNAEPATAGNANAPAATTTGAPVGATPPAAAPAPAAAPVATATPAAAGGNELVFTAREDSWISVTPQKGGKPLVSRLVKAGSTETVNVSEPVRVVVGNAPGVSATLRGAPVELPGKTARISLK